MAYPYSSYRRPRRRASRYPRRRIGRVRGRGSYATDMGKLALHHGGGFLGGAIGGLAPGLGGIGSQLGTWAGDRVASIIGLGAYQVKANSLTMPEGHQVPAFGDLSDAVIIKHREYVGDISVPILPGQFNNTAFVLNPGLPGSFPWLSNIAESFDSYMWLGIIYEFRSTSADIGSATTLGMGTVIMATDYDAHDPTYPTKLAMENAQYTTSCKPSESFVHVIECDPSVTAQPHLFIRQGAVPAGQDARFYDHGTMQIATQGLPTGATGTIGELWVTYQVAFFKPQLHNTGDPLAGFHYTTLTWGASERWGSGTFTTDVHNTLPFTVSGNVLTILNTTIGDCFLLVCRYHHAAFTYLAGTLTATSNCNLARSEIQGAVGTGNVTEYNIQFTIQVTGPNPSITLSNTSIAAGLQTSLSCFCVRITPNLFN